MSYDHLTRQSSLIPVSVLTTPIHVVGAGAVGSFTVLSLAKMGFSSIHVYDDDTVSVENMNCQFYRFSDIGSLKVEALANLVRDFTGITIHTSPERIVSDSFRPSGILIVAVDNMKSRSEIWSANEFNGRLLLYIDPRMAVEELAVRAVVPLTPAADKYPTTLYTDSQAVAEPCTARATMYTSLLISGLVCTVVKQRLCNDTWPTTYLYEIAAGDLTTIKGGTN